MSFFSHPKALVDEDAVIGDETRVWAFAHVMKGAQVGARCNIGNQAFVEAGAVLGDDVTVKNGVNVWEGVTCEDGVFLGPNCVLTNDRFPRSLPKTPKEEWLEPTLIKKGATLGANCTVVCGTTIHEYAMIGAGAVVTRNVPAHALMLGAPARIVGWVCKCGHRLKVEGTHGKCSKCNITVAQLAVEQM